MPPDVMVDLDLNWGEGQAATSLPVGRLYGAMKTCQHQPRCSCPDASGGLVEQPCPFGREANGYTAGPAQPPLRAFQEDSSGMLKPGIHLNQATSLSKRLGPLQSTGRIIKTADLEVRRLPSRAKWVVREDMLLIPNHRNSIKAGRSVVLVPSEYDGIVVTSRFIVARSNIPAIYLYHVLNLDIVKQKMLTLVSGSSSTEVKFEQLSEIIVPLPKDGDFDLWLERIESLTEEVEEYRTTVEQKERELSAVFEELYN